MAVCFSLDFSFSPHLGSAVGDPVYHSVYHCQITVDDLLSFCSVGQITSFC